MDRKKILNDIATDFKDYSFLDSRLTVEKVLKSSRNTFDIKKRGDIKREVVVFRYLSGTSNYDVEADKPRELVQRFQALVFIEQPDSISAMEAADDRMLELSDQLIDWADQVDATSVNSDLWTISFTGVDAVQERDGYLTTNVNFQSIIKIR